MIVPAGKRKEQVSQGGRKYESIMDNDLFANFAAKMLKKVALSPSAPPQKSPGGGDELGQNLNRALGPGSNSPQISGQPPAQMGDLPPGEDVGLGQDGITPAGQPRRQPGQPPQAAAGAGGGGAPADQFIGPAQETDQGAIDGFAQEKQRVRGFLGWENFDVEMDANDSGIFKVVVTPLQGQPVDVGGLIEGLQQHTGGQWRGEKTPARKKGGPITLTYTPQGMGVPDKISKPGKT